MSARRTALRRARLLNAAVEVLETRRLLSGNPPLVPNPPIVVNTTDDESVVNATTSLREAIALAVATPGDDAITFDPTVFAGGSLHTITLGAVPLEIVAAGGKVTIDGPGSAVLAISGATSRQSFIVDF